MWANEFGNYTRNLYSGHAAGAHGPRRISGWEGADRSPNSASHPQAATTHSGTRRSTQCSVEQPLPTHCATLALLSCSRGESTVSAPGRSVLEDETRASSAAPSCALPVMASRASRPTRSRWGPAGWSRERREGRAPGVMKKPSMNSGAVLMYHASWSEHPKGANYHLRRLACLSLGFAPCGPGRGRSGEPTTGCTQGSPRRLAPTRTLKPTVRECLGGACSHLRDCSAQSILSRLVLKGAPSYATGFAHARRLCGTRTRFTNCFLDAEGEPPWLGLETPFSATEEARAIVEEWIGGWRTDGLPRRRH